MTLIKTGFGISALSGKLGDTVYARNRGGMYARAMAIPVQPDSPDQIDKWQIWTDAADAYNSLSSEELDRWRTYATQLQGQNRLGEPISYTGQQIFWECFTNASLAGLTPITIPSAFSDRPAITETGDLVCTWNGSNIGFMFLNGMASISPSGGGNVSLFYAAPNLRPSVRNVNNQFRLIGVFGAGSGIKNYKSAYIAKFGDVAEIGWLSHLKIRVIDGQSMLGSTHVLKESIITS